MKLTNNQSGAVLAETMAAGVILILISLFVIRGFQISNELIRRGEEIKRQGQETYRSLEQKETPFSSQSKQISVIMNQEEAATISVMEYGYGENPTLYKMEPGESEYAASLDVD